MGPGRANVTPAPEMVPFESVRSVSDGIELRFHVEPGLIYSVWSRPHLAEGSWQTLSNVVSKFNPLDAVVVDLPGDGTRYYQLAITGQVD